jgi:hypothetical protein
MFEPLEGRVLLSAVVNNGILTITGTDHADHINVIQRRSVLIVHEGSATARFGKKHISSIVINALGGNDKIKVTSKLSTTIDGGDGKDLIIGGAGNDVLLGGKGNDRILGQAGNDSMSGGAGRDALFGGIGDDTLDAFDTEADQVAGGAGNDSARVDTNIDTAWNVDNYLEVTTDSSGTITETSTNGSTVNVNAGKLNITSPNAGTGAVAINSGGTIGGVGTLALTNIGSGTLNISDLGAVGFGDYVLIDYGGSILGSGDSVNILSNFSLGGSLNISAASGFTTGSPTNESPTDPGATDEASVVTDDSTTAAPTDSLPA